MNWIYLRQDIENASIIVDRGRKSIHYSSGVFRLLFISTSGVADHQVHILHRGLLVHPVSIMGISRKLLLEKADCVSICAGDDISRAVCAVSVSSYHDQADIRQTWSAM